MLTLYAGSHAINTALTPLPPLHLSLANNRDFDWLLSNYMYHSGRLVYTLAPSMVEHVGGHGSWGYAYMRASCATPFCSNPEFGTWCFTRTAFHFTR